MRVRRAVRQNPEPTVDIRASAPCEFLLHLSECSLDGPFTATTLGKVWFARERARVAPDLLAAVRPFSATDASVLLWTRLIGLAEGTPAPHDVPAFLAHIATTPPLQLRLALLGDHAQPLERRALVETLYAAAQGGAAAIGEVAARHFPTDRARREALAALLARDSDETHAYLLALLRRWYEEVFRAQEGTLLPILERDAAAKRALRRNLPLVALVEAATNGNDYRPDPGVERVVLVPTYILRPFTETQRHRATEILCYPVADESLDEAGADPSARLLRLYGALGDERRLRILRHIAAERATAQQLVDALGLPKSSLHYHLGILRAAGLLRVGAEVRGYTYGLRREGLADLRESLLGYLDDARP